MEKNEEEFRDNEFAGDIAAGVMRVLENEHFFERLDDVFAPISPASIPGKCEHTYAAAIEILKVLRMDSEGIADVFAVLKSRGGCCDCEILSNVAEASRLKAAYWKARFIKSSEERGFEHR